MGVESYHSTSGSTTWTTIILLHQLTHKHWHTPAGGEKKHSVYWFLDEHRSHAQLIVLWGVAAPIIIRLQVEINAETRGWRKEEGGGGKDIKSCFSFREARNVSNTKKSCSNRHHQSTRLFIMFNLVHLPAAVSPVDSVQVFVHSCCWITRCKFYQSTAETTQHSQWRVRVFVSVCECRLFIFLPTAPQRSASGSPSIIVIFTPELLLLLYVRVCCPTLNASAW